MNVLLILTRGSSRDMKVIVKLESIKLRNRVISLLKEKKEREAFDLVFSRGTVAHYIPPGKRTELKPDLTLIEDLI